MTELTPEGRQAQAAYEDAEERFRAELGQGRPERVAELREAVLAADAHRLDVARTSAESPEPEAAHAVLAEASAPEAEAGS